jgi:hypothetical protein
MEEVSVGVYVQCLRILDGCTPNVGSSCCYSRCVFDALQLAEMAPGPTGLFGTRLRSDQFSQSLLTAVRRVAEVGVDPRVVLQDTVGRTGPEVGAVPGDQSGEIGGAHGSILGSCWWN